MIRRNGTKDEWAVKRWTVVLAGIITLLSAGFGMGSWVKATESHAAVSDRAVVDLAANMTAMKDGTTVLATEMVTLKADVGTLKSDVGTLREDVSGIKATEHLMLDELRQLRRAQGR